VDLPLDAPHDLVRPWRTAALVAGAIALVELLILLGIGGLALARVVAHSVQHSASAHSERTHATPRQLAKHTTKIASARLPRSRTEVLVLNGNGRQGAAAVEAARVRRHGYRIGGVANADRSDYVRSIVMYRPRYAGEGHRLARDLGIGLVTPLDGMRPRQLHGAQVVVILGR
jgi:LytR cell envelope-related transcriptional attenuator